MIQSPFVFGRTVSSKAFTDRKEESLKLSKNLTQGVNTMIISPRRWGKSSLVEKVISDINREEPAIKTLIIDLFSISSSEQFLEVFAREVLKASSSKWQDWLQTSKDLFRRLIPKLTFGTDPYTDFSISFDWKELNRFPDEVLNLAETIARKQGCRFIVCLDEFQSLADFNDYEHFEKLMRAIWQRQKSVTYCLYGSKRHMMLSIFDDPSKPFYRFGEIMLLQKIPMEDWVSFITAAFESSGKAISEELAKKIADSMDCHPWYVQQLAHNCWQATEKTTGMAELDYALTEVLQANQPLYQKEIDSLSTTQINLLKAILQGETQLTSSALMLHYRLGTPNNVTKNRASLIKRDVIHENQGRFEFLDPIFRMWFRKVFLS